MFAIIELASSLSAIKRKRSWNSRKRRFPCGLAAIELIAASNLFSSTDSNHSLISCRAMGLGVTETVRPRSINNPRLRPFLIRPIALLKMIVLSISRSVIFLSFKMNSSSLARSSLHPINSNKERLCIITLSSSLREDSRTSEVRNSEVSILTSSMLDNEEPMLCTNPILPSLKFVILS